MRIDEPQSQFYLVEPTGMDSCGLVSYSVGDARKTWLCPRCCAVRYEKPVDVRLDDDPPDQPLNFIAPTLLGIMSRQFRDALGEELIEKYFHVGSISFRGTMRSADWFTFHGKEKTTVYRSKSVTTSTCEVCGRCMSSGTGKPYLCRPRLNIEIFDQGLGSLVISERVNARLGNHKWKNLAISKLQVKDDTV